MTVRVRGIYTTALTVLFDDVVQASPAIQDRFDDSFSMTPAESTIETTADRQGIGVHDTSTDSGAHEAAVDRLRNLALDTLAWRARLPRGGIFAGEVVETLGSGAVVQCTPADHRPAASNPESDDPLPADGQTAGFLPYSKTADRVEEGDHLLVQVTESQPPWSDSRPLLDTTIRVEGGLATLIPGGSTGSGQPDLADILPAEPPERWAISWDRRADDADLDELSAVVERLG
ncbi:MAG: RNA-binding protein, partial [Halovenus sp.]